MSHTGIQDSETKTQTHRVEFPNEQASVNVEHLTFNTRLVARSLIAVIVTIVVVGAIANYAVYNVAPHPDHPIADVLKRFDLGHEPSIPAFYSATMMVLSAALLCFLGRFDRSGEGSRKRYWYALAILFVCLAIDENVMFHEMATAAMDQMNIGGPFYFSWIIPGAIFAAVVGLAFMRFLWSLDRRTRNLLMLSGIVFLSGALGMESIAGVIFAAAENEESAIRSVSHVIVQALEEGLEMAGVAIFFCTLLAYANRCGLGIDIRHDANRFATSHMNAAKLACRGCGAPDPYVFFEVPKVPANVGTLERSAGKARQAICGQIRLAACDRCGLIQNQLFDVDIVGFEPGYEVSLFHTPTFREYIQGVCDRLIQRYDLHGKHILEIGCGGGDFLRLICRAGSNHGVGIDPTIATASEEPLSGGSVKLIPGYFSPQHDQYIGDFVCCLSVFEDIPEPLQFLTSLRESIGDRDVPVYFEVFNGFRSIQQQEVWSIHYEQCNYFSLESLVGLFGRAGFEVTQADTCYQGDQYLYVEARPAEVQQGETDFADMIPIVKRFAVEYQRRIDTWDQTLAAWKAENKCAVLWGSGGKGISFLSSLAKSDAVKFVVDVNPDRQNHFIPIGGQQIIDPGELTEIRPDAVILSNPLYEREITQQLDELGLRPEILVA